jgi:uncharacterized membrane protein YdjX (TVP38/TMEM64 family)
MHKLLPPITLLGLVLAVPIVPFLCFGEPLERQAEAWLDDSLPRSTVVVTVVGLLATDVFLPVPSSVVSTFAGRVLGFALGTAVSWLGMTLGAAIAFLLARAFGRRLALKFAAEEDLERTDALSRRFGPMVLVLARPVPVLAEASVLLLGTTDLPWRRFLVPIGLSNLGIAAAYAALGELVELPIALAAAIALPLAAATIARKLWPADEPSTG